MQEESYIIENYNDLYIRKYDKFYALEKINNDISITLLKDKDLSVISDAFSEEVMKDLEALYSEDTVKTQEEDEEECL